MKSRKGKTESKTIELIQRESRTVAARGWGLGRWGDVSQRVQTFSYKMTTFWGTNVQDGDYS